MKKTRFTDEKSVGILLDAETNTMSGVGLSSMIPMTMEHHSSV